MVVSFMFAVKINEGRKKANKILKKNYNVMWDFFMKVGKFGKLASFQ